MDDKSIGPRRERSLLQAFCVVPPEWATLRASLGVLGVAHHAIAKSEFAAFSTLDIKVPSYYYCDRKLRACTIYRCRLLENQTGIEPRSKDGSRIRIALRKGLLIWSLPVRDRRADATYRISIASDHRHWPWRTVNVKKNNLASRRILDFILISCAPVVVTVSLYACRMHEYKTGRIHMLCFVATRISIPRFYYCHMFSSLLLLTHHIACVFPCEERKGHGNCKPCRNNFGTDFVTFFFLLRSSLILILATRH